MKRGAFRLQAVLELRRSQERTAAVAAADAARRATLSEQHATEAGAALAGAYAPTGVDGAGFLAAMVGRAALSTDLVEARAAATATAEQSVAVRAAWTAAAQRAAALERLAERHRLAAVRAVRAAEERAVDDIVTGRHAGTTAIATSTDREETTWRD